MRRALSVLAALAAASVSCVSIGAAYDAVSDAPSAAPTLYSESLRIGEHADAVTGADVCAAASADACRTSQQPGDAAGFRSPSSVAVDSRNGDLYVADLANYRIEKFTPAGRFLETFGGGVNRTEDARQDASPALRDLCTAASGDRCGPGVLGGAPGDISYPVSIAVDPGSGDLYVLENGEQDDRLDKYTPDGRLIWMVGKGVDRGTRGNFCDGREVSHCGPGERAAVNSDEHGALRSVAQHGDMVAVGGPEDLVYVGDEHRVQVFDGQGRWRKEIGLTSVAAGPLAVATSVAVEPSGALYVVYRTPGFWDGEEVEREDLVRRFDPHGEQAEQFPVLARLPGAEAYVDGIALGPDGRLAAIGVEATRNSYERFGFVYDATGRLVGEFPPPQDDDGLTIDSGGGLWVAATDDQEVVGYAPVPALRLLASLVPCEAWPATAAARLECSLVGATSTSPAASVAPGSSSPSTSVSAGGSELVFEPPTPAVLARMRQDEDDDDEGMKPGGPYSVYDEDADVDNDRRDREPRYEDSDDVAALAYGRPVDAADRGELTALVERYYRDAVAGDGSAACALIARQFARSIPQSYGRGGPAYMRGRTCAESMSGLFRHIHRSLTGTTTIVAIRVSGGQGTVFIGSSGRAAGALNVERERGAWRVQGLLAIPLS